MKTPMEWVEYFQDKEPPAELAEQVAEIFAECQRDAIAAAAKTIKNVLDQYESCSGDEAEDGAETVDAEDVNQDLRELLADVRALAPKKRRRR